MADDEETVDAGGEETLEQPVEEEGAPAYGGAEFVPEASAKPKPDIYTVLLITAFLAFLAGCILAGNELHDFYDVGFWVMQKK